MPAAGAAARRRDCEPEQKEQSVGWLAAMAEQALWESERSAVRKRQ